MSEMLTCVRIIVDNRCTQHSTKQFWLSSLLSSRWATELRRCLLDGRGSGYHVLDGSQDRTNLFAAARGDKMATRPFAKLFRTIFITKRCSSILPPTTTC